MLFCRTSCPQAKTPFPAKLGRNKLKVGRAFELFMVVLLSYPQGVGRAFELFMVVLLSYPQGINPPKSLGDKGFQRLNPVPQDI